VRCLYICIVILGEGGRGRAWYGVTERLQWGVGAEYVGTGVQVCVDVGAGVFGMRFRCRLIW